MKLSNAMGSHIYHISKALSQPDILLRGRMLTKFRFERNSSYNPCTTRMRKDYNLKVERQIWREGKVPENICVISISYLSFV